MPITQEEFDDLSLENRLRYSARAIAASAPVCQLMEEAADKIKNLSAENYSMRRTFGSDPLFKEKDAEIAKLKKELGRMPLTLPE